MYTLEELSELGARGASQFHTNFTRLYRVGILRIAAFMFLYAATYTLQLCIVYKAVFCCCLVGFFFTWCKTHQKRSESLDTNSHKNANKCKTSTVRKKKSLNRVLYLSSFPYHCHSLWYVLSFSVSSDLKLIRGMNGNDADFSLPCVRSDLGFVILLPQHIYFPYRKNV